VSGVPNCKTTANTRRLVLWTCLTLFLLSLSFGVAFFPHIFWLVSERRLELQNTQGLPDRALQKVEIPDDWIEYSFGTVKFKLPTGLTIHQDLMDSASTEHFIDDESLSVYIVDTSAERSLFQLVELASAFHPHSDVMTFPRLKLDCFRRSSSDFSWAMTWREVRYHGFCITWGRIRPPDIEYVETSFGEAVDKLICFNDHTVGIWWHSLDLQSEGYMTFVDSQNKIDFEMVRQICKSIDVITETSSNLSQDE